MTSAVINMEQNIRGIPTISNSMNNMNTQLNPILSLKLYEGFRLFS